MKDKIPMSPTQSFLFPSILFRKRRILLLLIFILSLCVLYYNKLLVPSTNNRLVSVMENDNFPIQLDLNSDFQQKKSQDLTQEDSHQISHESTSVFLTFVTSEDLTSLRELSMHYWRESHQDVHNLLIVGFGLTLREKKEISLWRKVSCLDAEQDLLLGHRPIQSQQEEEKLNPHQSELLLMGALKYYLSKYQSVIYLSPQLSFKRDSIHDLLDLVLKHGYFFITSQNKPEFKRPVYDDLEQQQQDQEKQSADENQILAEPPQKRLSFAPENHVDLTSFDAMGFQSQHQATRKLVDLMLQCFRGYHCDNQLLTSLELERWKLVWGSTENQVLPTPVKALTEVGLEKKKKEDPKQWFCHLLLREDILYTFEYALHSDVEKSKQHTFESPLKPFQQPPPSLLFSKSQKKIPVAIGMPTLSVKNLANVDQVAPLTVFLPSLLKTVTKEEWDLFGIVIYVGFDEGDWVFDDLENRKKVEQGMRQLITDYETKNQLKTDIRFEFIRFPYSKGWVTYIWNGLFVSAMHAGCHYFYQVNDDLKLTSPQWLTLYVNQMTKTGGFGVVGPHDWRHGGKLLTQAFVSRVHYWIFGRIYPIDIKDWYSDNWITEVYGPENTFVIEGASAENQNNQGTRYTICDKPRYKEVLEAGKKSLQDWIDDLKILKSHSEKEGAERLEKELVGESLLI